MGVFDGNRVRNKNKEKTSENRNKKVDSKIDKQALSKLGRRLNIFSIQRTKNKATNESSESES